MGVYRVNSLHGIAFGEDSSIVIRRLPSHPHLPSKLEEISKVLLQVTGVPVHLSPIRTSHSPKGLYNDCKGSEANGPLQRTQTSPIPG